MQDTTVFVYGSLRKGEYNRGVVEPHILNTLGEGCIQGQMVSLGAYPAVLLDKPGIVVGEWLRVTARGMAALDRLEGYPTLYSKAHVWDVQNNIEGVVYYMTEQQLSRFLRGGRNGMVVPGGDWTAYRREQRLQQA